MSNQLRAAIIAVAQSAFPVLVLFGLDLSDEQVAGIMLLITNFITLVALIFPAPPTVVEREVIKVLDEMPASAFEPLRKETIREY